MLDGQEKDFQLRQSGRRPRAGMRSYGANPCILGGKTRPSISTRMSLNLTFGLHALSERLLRGKAILDASR